MKKERFIIGLNHLDQSILCSKSKEAIARHLGISSKTVARRQANGNYQGAKYSIWFDQSIERINRGGNGFK